MSSENMDVVRGLFEAFVTEGLDTAGERFLDRDAESSKTRPGQRVELSGAR